jgi:hypothetical protein
VWDFAVEISVLRELGLTNSDLRWLKCKGFVAHGRELTPDSEDRRVFIKSDGLTFRRTTCFVAQEAGVKLIRETLDRLRQLPVLDTPACLHDASLESFQNEKNNRLGAETFNPNNGRVDTQLPEWDRDRQELRVGDRIVKRYKVPAPNQELILTVFQEEGWPVHIHDPLPQISSQDPKRRLHDTINSLNRCQKNPLIRFLGDGKGTGVRWEFCRRND